MKNFNGKDYIAKPVILIRNIKGENYNNKKTILRTVQEGDIFKMYEDTSCTTVTKNKNGGELFIATTPAFYNSINKSIQIGTVPYNE